MVAGCWPLGRVVEFVAGGWLRPPASPTRAGMGDAAWTNYSDLLFGHRDKQFMAYFPIASTPQSLRTVRDAVAGRSGLSFNAALGRRPVFSQFDLMGHAMLRLGYPAEPCRAVRDLQPQDWCAHRPHPVAHVPYPDRCILHRDPVASILQLGRLYGPRAGQACARRNGPPQNGSFLFAPQEA